MKRVRVAFDERLLAKFDSDADVQRIGRSAVLRRLVSDYLRQKTQAAIDARYRKAYSDRKGLGSELEGWDEEGVWPTE